MSRPRKETYGCLHPATRDDILLLYMRKRSLSAVGRYVGLSPNRVSQLIPQWARKQSVYHHPDERCYDCGRRRLDYTGFWCLGRCQTCYQRHYYNRNLKNKKGLKARHAS